MLRIAVPNKGSLADSSISILKEAGYRQRSDSRDLVLIDPENNVEFYYLRPRDIAIYVGTGELEAGITGRDLLIDSGATAEEILSLDFGRSTFRFAAPVGKNLKPADISGKRVATAYPGLVEDFLRKNSLTASVVRLDGAVESSVRLGVADLIADVTAHAVRQAHRGAAASGLYHLVAGGETSWHGYASHVIAQAQKLRPELNWAVKDIAPVPTTAFPTPACRPLNSRLNTHKLQSQFELALPHWQQGVDRLLAEIL